MSAQESSTSEKWQDNCTVIVILNDVNEYDPEFTRVNYHAVVDENEASGARVITVCSSSGKIVIQQVI